MKLEFKQVNCYQIELDGKPYIFNEIGSWEMFTKLGNDELGVMYCAKDGNGVFDSLFGFGGFTIVTASDKIVELIKKGKE